MLDGVLDHLTHSLVEDNVGHVFANAFRQKKCSCMEERIKIAQQSKKQLKFET
jgi:hypothetical protein